MDIVAPVCTFRLVWVPYDASTHQWTTFRFFCVEVELDSVDFCIKLAEHPSELFPVVFVWTSHFRREERNCWLDVYPCMLAEEEELDHQLVEDDLVSIA